MGEGRGRGPLWHDRGIFQLCLPPDCKVPSSYFIAYCVMAAEQLVLFCLKQRTVIFVFSSCGTGKINMALSEGPHMSTEYVKIKIKKGLAYGPYIKILLSVGLGGDWAARGHWPSWLKCLYNTHWIWIRSWSEWWRFWTGDGWQYGASESGSGDRITNREANRP